jgi:hypothetical protein
MPVKKTNLDYNTETNVSSRSPNKTAISSPGKRGSFGNQVPYLFGLIKRQKISEENLDGWFTLFNSNRIAAMADLTNFVSRVHFYLIFLKISIIILFFVICHMNQLYDISYFIYKFYEDFNVCRSHQKLDPERH